MPEVSEVPATWAIVELLGHVRLAGRVTEEEKFGVKMGRLDIPDGDGFITKYFGGGSIYSLTIVSEEVARQVAKGCRDRQPVQPWDFPKQLSAAPVDGRNPFEDPGREATGFDDDDGDFCRD